MIKKLLFSAFTLVSVTAIIAQPSNKGFETWTPNQGVTTYEDPSNWQTTNLLNQILLGGNPVSCFKSTDAHSGNFSMRLKSVKLTQNPAPTLINDTTGGAFTGALGIVPLKLKMGYADTVRPYSMKFWMKSNLQPNDTASGMIILQKRTGKVIDTIGVGYYPIYTNMSVWTMAEVPIVYFSTAQPDTITVLFSATSYNKPKVGSEFWVDDVDYVKWVGVNDLEKPNINVSIFPNPAQSFTTFTVSSDVAKYIEVYDISGRKVDTYTMTGLSHRIETSDFSEGVYSYTILNNDKAVLTRGKFSVAKQ